MSVGMQDHTRDNNIAVIGAGVGGLAFAIALKRQLGFKNFRIYEKSSDIGGTWRDNAYPGCSSDTPIHTYSLSTDLKPDWPRFLGNRQEIESYWQSLAQKYCLRQHICFDTEVLSAEWNSEQQVYYIVCVDGQGRRTVRTAKILVSAVGLLSNPMYPPGVEKELSLNVNQRRFQGRMWHSARWDGSVSLTGKTVGVVGNASSAAQFIPLISEDKSTRVINFCRTPNWYLRGSNKPYHRFTQLLFTYVPFIMRLHYYYLLVKTDILFVINRNGGWLKSYFTESSVDYILQRTPAKYHSKLIPDFPPGCKRSVVDAGYLNCLHRENVELNWHGFESVDEDGVVTRGGGKVPVDMIIFATGFKTSECPVHIVGTEGSIADYYSSQGGPTAYLGTTVPGFPNYFMLYGPNTIIGHTSIITVEEAQINYILRLIKPILYGSLSSIAVTPRASDSYNVYLQSRLASTDSVFVHCMSWFRAGTEQRGKIANIFPEPFFVFWWRLRKVEWGDYVCIYKHGRKAERYHDEWYALCFRAALAVVSWGMKILFRSSN